MIDDPVYTELWVCFRRPPPPPPHVLVVSFLTPTEEEAAAADWGQQFLSGRAIIQDVRTQARTAYVDLVARIGATPLEDGRTLRQRLLGADGISRWWFHKLSEKDCVWDGDPTYTILLRLFAVRAIAEKHGLARIVVHGGGRGFAEALGLRRPGAVNRAMAVIAAVLRGIAGRLALLATHLRRRRLYRALRARRLHDCDILLEAHWDWSLMPDGAGLRERYFADLPARLSDRGLSVAWAACAEPAVEHWQHGRREREVFGPIAERHDVMLIESFASVADVARMVFDVQACLAVTAALRSPMFKSLFVVDGMDLLSILRRPLLRLAWSAGPARYALLALGMGNLCRVTQPRMLVTFLELFLHSKALYAGARAGASGIAIWAAQHAAYCSDKTFGVLDVPRERQGQPDGQPAPIPDGIFVMGDLARRLWRANGFTPERVLTTGGLRYQHITARHRDVVRDGRTLSVMLIAGMNEAADVDMCDAVTTAAKHLDVRVRLRDHPQYRLSRMRAFTRFEKSIDVTTGTADEDMAGVDLVMFTHSAFAEEALLRGIPTWQWLWPGFNTSVFLDLPVIPTFTSVSALREALQSFAADPKVYQPSRETQEYILRECFGTDPARASERIADTIVELMGVKHP